MEPLGKRPATDEIVHLTIMVIATAITHGRFYLERPFIFQPKAV